MATRTHSRGAALSVGLIALGTLVNFWAARTFLPGGRVPSKGPGQEPPALRARLPPGHAEEEDAQQAAGWPRLVAGVVALGLLVSVAGGSRPALAEDELVPEYDGRVARSTEKVLQRKVKASKTKKASTTEPAAEPADAAKPAKSSAAMLPMPGQGRFDENGDFVLPSGTRDPMIPILEDNMPRRAESPTNETFFDMGQDKSVIKAKLALVIFGPGCLYLFFFITGSLGIL